MLYKSCIQYTQFFRQCFKIKEVVKLHPVDNLRLRESCKGHYRGNLGWNKEIASIVQCMSNRTVCRISFTLSMVGLKEVQRDLLKIFTVDDSVQHHGRSDRIFVLVTATSFPVCFISKETIAVFVANVIKSKVVV